MNICYFSDFYVDLMLIKLTKTNEEIQHALVAACLTKPKDGFAAEEMQVTKNFQSMASVGG